MLVVLRPLLYWPHAWKRVVRNDPLKRPMFSPWGRDFSLAVKSVHDIWLYIYWKWQMMCDRHVSLLNLDDLQCLGIWILLQVWLFCTVFMSTQKLWVTMSKWPSTNLDFEQSPRRMWLLVTGLSLSYFIDPVGFWWRLFSMSVKHRMDESPPDGNWLNFTELNAFCCWGHIGSRYTVHSSFLQLYTFHISFIVGIK